MCYYASVSLLQGISVVKWVYRICENIICGRIFQWTSGTEMNIWFLKGFVKTIRPKSTTPVIRSEWRRDDTWGWILSTYRINGTWLRLKRTKNRGQDQSDGSHKTMGPRGPYEFKRNIKPPNMTAHPKYSRCSHVDKRGCATKLDTTSTQNTFTTYSTNLVKLITKKTNV